MDPAPSYSNIVVRKNQSVSIDLKLLDLLMRIRRKDAATILGISETALKRACRKLGVKKWERKDFMLSPSSPHDKSRSKNSTDKERVLSSLVNSQHVTEVIRRRKTVS